MVSGWQGNALIDAQSTARSRLRADVLTVDEEPCLRQAQECHHVASELQGVVGSLSTLADATLAAPADDRILQMRSQLVLDALAAAHAAERHCRAYVQSVDDALGLVISADNS